MAVKVKDVFLFYYSLQWFENLCLNKREMIGPSGITNNETLKVVVREKSVGEICAFNNIAQRLKIVITYKP